MDRNSLDREPAHKKVYEFIKYEGHVTKDEIHRFVNEHNTAAGIQVLYDLMAAGYVTCIDGEYYVNE